MASIPVVPPYGMYHTNFAPITGTTVAQSHTLPPPATTDTAALRAQLDALQEEVRQLRAARTGTTTTTRNAAAAGPVRRKRPTTALRPIPTTTLVFGRHQTPPQSRPTSKGKATTAANVALPVSDAPNMAVHPLSLQHSPQPQATSAAHMTAFDRQLASMQPYVPYNPHPATTTDAYGAAPDRAAIEVRMSAEAPPQTHTSALQGQAGANYNANDVTTAALDKALKEENALLKAELVVLRDTLRQRDELLRKATHALHEVETRRQANRLAGSLHSNNNSVEEDRVTVRLLSDELLEMQRRMSELTQAKATAEEQQRLAETLLATREQELQRLRAQVAGTNKEAGATHNAIEEQRIDATTNTEPAVAATTTQDAAATAAVKVTEEDKKEEDEKKHTAELLAKAVRKVEAWETWYRTHYHRSGKPRTSHKQLDAELTDKLDKDHANFSVKCEGDPITTHSRHKKAASVPHHTQPVAHVPWSALYDMPTHTPAPLLPLTNTSANVPYMWQAWPTFSRPVATPPAQTPAGVNKSTSETSALQLVYPKERDGRGERGNTYEGSEGGAVCALGLETIEFLAKEAALRELADKERAAAERRLAEHRTALAAATASEANAGGSSVKEGTSATPPPPPKEAV